MVKTNNVSTKWKNVLETPYNLRKCPSKYYLHKLIAMHKALTDKERLLMAIFSNIKYAKISNEVFSNSILT